jgi:hypothetical protein
VPRLLGDHGQRQQAEFAIVERPAAAPAFGTLAAMVMVVTMPPMTAIRHVIGLGELTV